VALGVYISVPFCRTKCTYCNFASDVFSGAAFDRYVERVCADISASSRTAERVGGSWEQEVDSVYLGGGTPTVLDSQQLRKLFVTIWQNFNLLPDAEITAECAPGTLTPQLVETLVTCGVTRMSLGVQSFVDREAASVGRLHKRAVVREDILQLRKAGILNLNLDLIAGLPHQTAESWEISLAEALSSGAPHVSVYMLEVDEDSRLGRELIAGGTRYHAHFVPNDELTADLYLAACERLEAGGLRQYEISNFARPGLASRHNLKYWTRQPYLGFGVDAHSMLRSVNPERDAIRFATPDTLENYVAGGELQVIPVPAHDALEESFFLGLRLTEGVDLQSLRRRFGHEAVRDHCSAIAQATAEGLLLHERDRIHLTARGRLLSNEVFARFLSAEKSTV
jgi:oxygen-independent coproporphyrinogen-3 oxidase